MPLAPTPISSSRGFLSGQLQYLPALRRMRRVIFETEGALTPHARATSVCEKPRKNAAISIRSREVRYCLRNSCAQTVRSR
jgi:hypothetical protein